MLLTAASSWITVAYAFGLRYFRMHCAGERFDFGVDGTPRFADFLAMAAMISAAGALAAGTPRTVAALAAVRTHTVVAFVFNALVVAMTVSLISGLITAAGTV